MILKIWDNKKLVSTIYSEKHKMGKPGKLTLNRRQGAERNIGPCTRLATRLDENLWKIHIN